MNSQNPTLIDLIISNQPDFVQNIMFLPPFGLSHHSVIVFDLDINPPSRCSETTPKFQFNKGDYDGMREQFKQLKLEVDLLEIADDSQRPLTLEDVDKAWDIIESNIEKEK